jgi:hypothetical protein
VDKEDEEGHTALWVAAATGGCEAVRLLSQFGANVNLKAGGPKGTTPLGIATQVCKYVGRQADEIGRQMGRWQGK